MLSVTSMSEFNTGQYPFVNGSTITLNQNPVSDVQIHVYFPSEIIKTSTNSFGHFSATSTIPSQLGEYTITVYAKKDNRYTSTTVTYLVTDSLPVAIVDNSLKNKTHVEPDPFSKMLKQIEEQKTKDIQQKILTEDQQHISELRIQAQIDLQNDLKSSEKEHEFNSPRNAFLRFLADVDYSIKNIFWQQFLFTEKLTSDAQDAKEQALDEGKSSVESMKIFQQKAAISKDKLIEHNQNLNIQYGNATSEVQTSFDNKGKLPRNE